MDSNNRALIMYKIVNTLNGQSANCIKRIADNAFIPFDPANTDYQEYLAWLSSGNVPLPPDEMGGDTSTTATTE
jgi:hypothetical protein